MRMQGKFLPKTGKNINRKTYPSILKERVCFLFLDFFGKEKMNKSKVESKLLIYQKYVDVIEYGYNLLRKYPKSEKYGLTSEIRRSMFQVVRLILYANKISNKYNKLDVINKIDAEVTSQKFIVRFSYKCRYISNSNYYEWSKRLDEIRKIIGGWIKLCLKE